MGENTGHRWTDEEVLAVRRLVDEGVRSAEIADTLGRSEDAVNQMRARIKHEDVTEFRCARCHQLRPKEQFTPSRQVPGGYCTSCARAYERRTEQTEALPVDARSTMMEP